MDTLLGDSKETTVQYIPEQLQDIKNTLAFKEGTINPAYRDYLGQVQGGYQQNLPGMYKAAQNVAGYAGQVGQTLGETGESAARTGITGLTSFFAPGYGQEQFASAMAPIQSQYQQNLAAQQAQFGGMGQLGSARQALASRQLAGQTQSAQMQAAANVMNQLNQQRLQAAQALTGAGREYLGQGLGALGTGLGAAERPMDWTSTYGKQLGMIPGALYQPPYPGQQGTSTSSTPSLFDVGAKILPYLISDERLKENIKHVDTVKGVPIYNYNYIWDKTPRTGPMAQDLLNTEYADAVHMRQDGYYMVDYSRLPAELAIR